MPPCLSDRPRSVGGIAFFFFVCSQIFGSFLRRYVLARRGRENGEIHLGRMASVGEGAGAMARSSRKNWLCAYMRMPLLDHDCIEAAGSRAVIAAGSCGVRKCMHRCLGR